MEKWDVYDRNGNITGIIKTRQDTFEDGEYHLGASIWIVNHLGEVLIQKRSASKRFGANNWASTGGSVIAGETSIQGCIREVKEELGLDITENDIEFLSRKFGKNNIFDDFIMLRDVPLEDFSLQPNEVSEVKYVCIDEIKDLMMSGNFMVDDPKELDFLIAYIDNNINNPSGEVKNV